MKLFILSLLICAGASSMGQDAGEPSMDKRFVKHVLTSDFLSEGVAVADINRMSKTNPALVAQGTIQGGLLTDPQDVAAAGPGAFYVSNGTGGSSIERQLAGYGVLPGSNILYFNGMSFRVAIERTPVPPISLSKKSGRLARNRPQCDQ